MASYALIRDGRVVNLIEWDGVADYAPPAGTQIVPAEQAVAEDVAGGVFLPETDAV